MRPFLLLADYKQIRAPDASGTLISYHLMIIRLKRGRLLQAVLVGLDHLLERVTRTTATTGNPCNC